MILANQTVAIPPAEAVLWPAAVATITNLLKIFSFSDFFHAAAASLAKLLNADGVALIVRDGPDRLRYRLFYGLDRINQDSIVKFSFAADQGTAGYVVATGQPLFTEDYPGSQNAIPEFVEAGLRSNLVLPLPGPSGFLGAIAIAWIHRYSRSPEPSNIAIADMFAALIGSAVYREQLQKQLEDHSLTDPLTGLPNRRMLMMRLIEAQKRACRNQTLMGLAVLDLDGFKMINDRLGHAVGDQKLLSAADAIRGALRDVDMIARLGGDEFVLILENLRSRHEIQSILHRVVCAVDRHLNEDDTACKVTASLGATIYPLDFAEPQKLLKHADTAMYQSKRSGGDQFYIFKPERG